MTIKAQISQSEHEEINELGAKLENDPESLAMLYNIAKHVARLEHAIRKIRSATTPASWTEQEKHAFSLLPEGKAIGKAVRTEEQK